LRRHEEHDLEDLKKLLMLVIYWIEMELLTEKFKEEIQSS